jgi:hypothetical protein
MLLYKDTFKCDNPFNIVFLCGCRYNENGPNEKRNVLKKFLEDNICGCNAIILEEHFMFAKTNKHYLSYDDIFLNNLSQVEQLASLFANKIIILHETISTATELGMFAINVSLLRKICLLTPDDISIEEQKASTFIKLAFKNNNTPEMKLGKHIIFYPDVDVHKVSTNKIDYYTYFHNNEIGQNLGGKITKFIKSKKAEDIIKFSKNQFGIPNTNEYQIDYYIDVDEMKIKIYVHPEVLKIQILALFFIEEYRKQFRLPKEIKDHVTFIHEEYSEILLNTIAELEGIEFIDYEPEIRLKDTDCKLRQSIGYFLYMLQACELIILERTSKLNESIRKIRLTNDLEICKSKVANLIYEKENTAFGRLKI